MMKPSLGIADAAATLSSFSFVEGRSLALAKLYTGLWSFAVGLLFRHPPVVTQNNHEETYVRMSIQDSNPVLLK
jgi:hypothetical protein